MSVEEESSGSYVFTVLALAAGAFVLHRVLFGKKKKAYRSGLNREVVLAKCSSLRQKVEKQKDGSTVVRPAEGGAADASPYLVNYEEHDGPFTGTERDFVKPQVKSKKGLASHAPVTVIDVFEKAVKRAGDRLAMTACTGKTWTWKEYYDEVVLAGKSLVSLGFEQHDTINILGFNSPEWLVLNNAAIFAGGMAAGVYATNGTEACEYLAQHSKAKIIAVENIKQLEKYIPVAGNLPAKVYVVWDKSANLAEAQPKFPEGVKILSYDEFLGLGKSAGDSAAMTLTTRMKAAQPGNSCTLIYTSGTTGNPKAVTITHDNCTWTAATTWANLCGDDDISDEEGGVVLISYLPLSHIAAQMLDVHAPLWCTAYLENSCSVYFADANALKGTLLQTLQKARPTYFFGVPRVWEKFNAAMVEKAKSNGALKKKISAWARSKGMEYLAIRENAKVIPGTQKPSMWKVASKILIKVREAIGLDRCRVCLVGAAPINRTTLEFFASLDVPVLELYGMSECTGPTTMSHLRGRGFKLGSTGVPLAGTELRIHHVEGRDKPGEGEIQFRGRHIMAGYLGEEQKTKDTITADGWLQSGDVGRVDENGLVFIVGRIKELLIGSGGENVAPVPVEERIKETLVQGVSNFVMIGDKKKFFVALVTLHCTPLPDGTFTQELTDNAKKIDPACTTTADAAKSAKWREFIQKGIDDYNENHAVSHAARIQKFEILLNDFSVPTEELGPTLKLKRNVVNEKYAKQIDALYPKE